MKNKFLLCACLVAMTAATLTSCKNDVDVFDVSSQIAQKTLQGFYTFIDVDSAAMNATLYEWQIEQDKTGARVGAYRVAATGNKKDVNTEKALTWEEAKMAEDGLSMTIPVLVDGEAKDLIWHDGVVSVDGYTTEKPLISMAGVLRTVHEKFVNLDFVHSDTTYYITTKKDTVYYLAWKTQVVNYTQAQIDSAKQALIELADTLAWYNETFGQNIPDTVKFSTKQQPDGTYKGQVSVPYEASKVEDIKTVHGPLHIVNGEMVFSRDAEGATTGSYFWHEETWTQECYTKPTKKEAVHTDELVTVSDANWAPVSFTNIKKFNVLFKGKGHTALLEEVAGEVKTDKTEDKDVFFLEAPISGFVAADGELTYKDYKFKNK